MPEEPKDAKTAEVPSTPPVAAAPQDDKEKPAESSPAQEAASPTEETLSTVVEKAAQESLSREAASAAEKLSSTEKKEPAEESKPAPAEASTEEVPKEFHEHPAWKRIIGERNEAREKITQLETAARANQGLIDYCRERNITDDQFKNALEIVGLMNADPAKAYERMKPLIEQLEAHVGLRIPDDLAAKVKEGILDPETAAEVARLRAERTFGATRQQHETQARQQALVSSMVEGLNAWDRNKQQTDPDFKDKAVMVRGYFREMYEAKDSSGRSLNPVQTAQDAVALAEKAYAAVNEYLRKFVPPKAEQRVLATQKATTVNNKKKPGSTREAVAAALREKYDFDLGDE